MKLAVVDLGTNSIRLFIYDLSPEREPENLFHTKEIIRLGEGLYPDMTLKEPAKQRCLDVLRSFADIMAGFNVDRVSAVATSALREANDGKMFLQKLIAETGVPLKIISGENEAQLIARGVLNTSNCKSGKTVIVDLGGGSTEIIFCSGSSCDFCISLPIGAVRGQDRRIL